MATRLAIVLSGGGAKGAFQVGVLDALVNGRGMKPKIVVGTSTGAIQALAVAQDDVAGLVEVWQSIKGNGDIYKRRDALAGAILGANAIYDAKPLQKLLKNFYKPDRVAASGIELRLGVVSLQSGQFQTIGQNATQLDRWVYASCAMPVFFDPLKTIDKQQWVDGGVRDVTPLSAALKLDPTGVLVIRASPAPKTPKPKSYSNFIEIGLRAVGILQSEVSLNDLENANLINDALAARDRMFAALQADGMPADKANAILKALDTALARYHFAQNRVIEPAEEYSETLEFEPAKIRKAIEAGRAALEANWDSLQPILR
jgi:NTE family protein